MDLDILRHYLIGIPHIDSQHRDLLVMANEIIANLKDNRKALDLLTAFVRATEQHFEDEENCMKEHGYPFIPNHVVEHKVIIHRLNALARDLRNTATRKMDRIYILEITRGLLNHIDNYDIQFGQYVAKKQMTQS